ncbi:MAG: endonuclease/exonuclease/phosphatase family protein [Planctomycetes bacterium]|nr:endonuclease/exonuclease/phosphatase family protein [Planctomycetota bacterium]
MLRYAFILLVPLAFAACGDLSLTPAEPAVRLDVMAWNIWRGGREDGEEVGVQKTIDVIRKSGVDVVAMQETYGSGETISEALGFEFHPRGTNVSIHSRYPIRADVSVFEEFKCVGAVIDVTGAQPVAFYSIWLPYGYEIWAENTRGPERTMEEMLGACRPSADDLAKMLPLIDAKLEEVGYADVPVIIAGDFNSMSHLDYIESSKDQYGGWVIDWPTSRVITDAGYVDSYRAVHIAVDRMADRTWTPRFPAQDQDRIDFIYGRGEDLVPKESHTIDIHPEGFPSDHAALVTQYRLVAR